MKNATAAAGAGAVVLTVAAAVSGLFLTIGAAGPAEVTPAQPVVLTEYVDEAGNPVAPPVAGTGPNLPRFVVVEPEAVESVAITEVAVQAPEPRASSAATYGSDDRDGRYDDDSEDEDRYEDEDRDVGDDDD